MTTIVQTTPAPNAFMKDFPGTHGKNMDDLDAFANTCLTTHPLKSYTPVLGSPGTPPTLGGAGFIRGFYYQIFDQIYAWGEFRFASGFTTGNSGYTISLPVAANSLIGASTDIGSAPGIGNGLVMDASADSGRQQVIAKLRTDMTLMFGVRMNSGASAREVRFDGPITWADGDGLSWSVRYKRA